MLKAVLQWGTLETQKKIAGKKISKNGEEDVR